MSCQAVAANCVEPAWLNCPHGWVFAIIVPVGVATVIAAGVLLSWILFWLGDHL